MKLCAHASPEEKFIYETSYDAHRWNMTLVHVTRNYQITLGRDVRRAMEVHIGDKLIAEVQNERIILKKAEKNPVTEAFGIWNMKDSSIEFVDKARNSWKERDEQHAQKKRSRR